MAKSQAIARRVAWSLGCSAEARVRLPPPRPQSWARARWKFGPRELACWQAANAPPPCRGGSLVASSVSHRPLVHYNDALLGPCCCDCKVGVPRLAADAFRKTRMDV